MIDAVSIVRALGEERRALAARHGFAEPNLTDAEKLARLEADYPVPPDDVLVHVIEEVFWASLLTEEGRPCRPRLLFGPPGGDPKRGGLPLHRLAETVPVSREKLRKLVPVQGSDGYLRWSRSADGAPVVTGVQPRGGVDHPNLLITAPQSGALDLTWMYFRLVCVRAGSIDQLSRYALPDVHRALDVARQVLGAFEPVFLGHAIRAIASAGHGGSIWIVREGCCVDGVVKGVSIGHPVAPDPLPVKERRDRFGWLASIGQLAAIDGAVLLDARLRVLGFGAFVKLDEEDVRVHELLPNGELQNISWTKTGGGRHRSAIAFCRVLAPAAAIVVSEDGRISLVATTAPEQPPLFLELGSLGLVDALT